jgi:hypothetical protein
MNGAGVLAYTNLIYGSYDWYSVRRVIDELALPYDPLPAEREASALADFLRQIPAPVMALPEMRETGRIGLITVDDYSYRRSTESLRRVDGPEGDTWLEALPIPDGRWLIAPQIQAEVAGIYFIAPVAQGPKSTQLVTFDTGIRAVGDPQPPSNVPEKCRRRVDDDLSWICVPGTCAGQCEPDGWKAGAGPAEITGCNCL